MWYFRGVYPGFADPSEYTFGLGRKWGIHSVPSRKCEWQVKNKVIVLLKREERRSRTGFVKGGKFSKFQISR
ncbi:MAG: hypothetical protein AUG08_06955 [Acidobacteria bacterium 13_1_20CM_2_55_15]|nr:MAG: hypothetical protein AUG08_06955 [Acidobacteria bacterium 13_1_20CM_2_55_15]PYS07413.1 MAG: hypothetical protein DMG17_30800 [Acidobacteriota bacterium]